MGRKAESERRVEAARLSRLCCHCLCERANASVRGDVHTLLGPSFACAYPCPPGCLFKLRLLRLCALVRLCVLADWLKRARARASTTRGDDEHPRAVACVCHCDADNSGDDRCIGDSTSANVRWSVTWACWTVVIVWRRAVWRAHLSSTADDVG